MTFNKPTPCNTQMVKYNFFTLYTIEFKSKQTNLLALATSFSHHAEVSYLDSKSGTVQLQLVSTASSEDIIKMCDDYKKEIESGTSAHLIYKVSSAM